MLAQFMAITASDDISHEALDALIRDYPVFFEQMLDAMNQQQILLPLQVDSIGQAISLGASKSIRHLFLFMVIYKSFAQYKIRGLDQQAFWQDSLRRAVSARILGSYAGLDASRCFLAGMMQDIGLLLLFLHQPAKAMLWQEFRKREPMARYSMEQNVFGLNHEQALDVFCRHWGIDDDLHLPLIYHHQDDRGRLSLTDQQLSEVLYCADWMASIYTADDKSFVMDRTRKILLDDFQLARFQIEEICTAIPRQVDKAAEDFTIEMEPHQAFSQVLMEANYKLSVDNDNFQELTLRLEQALEERDRLAAELNRELELAREIQKSLLPPLRDDGFPVCGINLSARNLSGDFYDYFQLDDGRIYFNLGDVSGKGANAALLMAKASSLFRCLGKRIPDPSELLAEINNELCETSINGMFITMIAGIYQPDSGHVLLVNAGNPPALLFSPEGLAREIEAKGPPLGIMENADFPATEFDLQNSSLYLFSDGVTEGLLEDGSMLELGGLYKMIATMDKTLSPVQRIQAIVSRFQSNQRALRDDVTLVLLERQD